MELTIQIFQFILSISILVILHELGHFLPARWFRTRAEKFFLFFDPYFSLFSMKKINGQWKFKFISQNLPDTETVLINGERKEVPINIDALPDSDWRKHPESTKYGIGWLPLGGYVKIAGMVDESMDTEQLKKPAESYEFRSKPAWQRLIIMLGGVTVNFFLAWLIYSCLSFFNGETYRDLNKFENGIGVMGSGQKMGFKNGDKILKVDGKPVDRYETASLNILFSNEVTVERDGKEHTFAVDEDGIAEVIRQREAKLYLTPRFKTVVDSLLPNSAAMKAGLQKGDEIVSVNGKKTVFFDELSEELSNNKGKPVSLGIVRANTPSQVTANVTKDGKL